LKPISVAIQANKISF